jgi:hypothetical protein
MYKRIAEPFGSATLAIGGGTSGATADAVEQHLLGLKQFAIEFEAALKTGCPR